MINLCLHVWTFLLFKVEVCICHLYHSLSKLVIHFNRVFKANKSKIPCQNQGKQMKNENDTNMFTEHKTEN